MKHIVILGGSWAGLITAHRFLKATAKSQTELDSKVTIISRDTHFFWNIASPRAIVPSKLSDEQVLQPIASGFAAYGGRAAVVHGTAVAVDFVAKTVVVQKGDSDERFDVQYDVLIIGTGSRTKGGGPFKSNGSSEKLRVMLHEYQEKIAQAQTIVVLGAGLTGCETASEIADAYGSKKRVILVSASMWWDSYSGHTFI